MDPEIVNERKQRWNGHIYSADPKNGYYKRGAAKGGLPRYLHREVWAAANGPIPAGMQIHHLDENNANNALGNLQALTSKEHAAMHWTPERAARSRRIMLEFAVPAARAWHSSPEGLEWHSQNGRAAWAGRKPTTLTCQVCGKQYETLRPQGSKFCHLNCKMTALRRRRGMKPGKPRTEWVDRICRICSQNYRAQPNRGAATCSDRCRRALLSLASNQPLPATFGT